MEIEFKDWESLVKMFLEDVKNLRRELYEG